MQYFMMPVMSVIFRRKLKEERPFPRSNKILQIGHNQGTRTYFMQMCRTGVKEVKVNAFKCVNFVSIGSLKNNSDTQ